MFRSKQIYSSENRADWAEPFKKSKLKNIFIFIFKKSFPSISIFQTASVSTPKLDIKMPPKRPSWFDIDLHKVAVIWEQMIGLQPESFYHSAVDRRVSLSNNNNNSLIISLRFRPTKQNHINYSGSLNSIWRSNSQRFCTSVFNPKPCNLNALQFTWLCNYIAST